MPTSTSGLREKLRPIVMEAAQYICQNTLPDGSPCRDCRYTQGVFGRKLIAVLMDEVDAVTHKRWCEEIRLSSMDG